MADGTINLQTERGENIVLVDAATGVDDGVWVDTSEFENGSIEVTIAATATVQIRGSNAITKPANNTHGTQIGTDITAAGMFAIEHCSRWTKGRVTAATGATSVLSMFRYGNKK